MVRRSSRIQKLSLAESAESEGPCVVPTQKKPAPKRQGKGEKRKRGEGREQSVPAKPCNAVEQMRAHERAAVAGGAQMVAGVDEAGRGVYLFTVQLERACVPSPTPPPFPFHIKNAPMPVCTCMQSCRRTCSPVTTRARHLSCG